MALLRGSTSTMTGWEERRPSGADEEIGRWTISRPPQLEDLRVALREMIAARVLPAGTDPADLVERLTMVTTELAGNALRHGCPPAVVAVTRCAGRIVVDVEDADPLTAPAIDTGRPSGAGGLGLRLTERLSDEVGWFPEASGKHVWAALTIAGR